MTKKSLILFILSFLIIGLIFGFSLVFAFSNNIDTKLVYKESNSIYTDSLKLNKVKVLFQSYDDLTKFSLKSSCDIFVKKPVHKNNFYLFELKYFDKKCLDKNVFLVNDRGEKTLSFKLNIFSESTILEKVLDYDTDILLKLQNKLVKNIKKYGPYIKYNKKVEKNYFEFLRKKRLLEEYVFNYNVISNIITKRNEKYIVPVVGKKIPKISSKVPNSGRPYRNSYTDGIHHGWDIDADFGDSVIAIDDGIIVRVISDFKFSDLNKINKSKNLTQDQKTLNLNLLRGNQVWLKTMRGDVVFLSHLDSILPNIKPGYVVRKGEVLGKIGISGIPDKNYNDYHVHFPIQKNPYYNDGRKYSFLDYMKWDWYFKGKSVKYVLEHEGDVFEN